MKKYLITGFSGFVSRHFLDLLEKMGEPVTVLGIDVSKPEFDLAAYKNVKCRYKSVDLLNRAEVDLVFKEFRPDYILHLASYSSVAFSWQNPVVSFTNNTNIFLNLIESLRVQDVKCRVLSVGSSEEYGNVTAADMPLTEEHSLNPVSPYAVARVSQEMLSGVYANGYGIDIVMTRSFNHIGPFQRDVFVIPSFAKQIVSIKKKRAAGNEISTGDLSIIRDFVDVRDVVKAYYLLLTKGAKGELYNVCSGTGVSLSEIMDKMMKIAGIEIKTKMNKDFVRPGDNRIIIGSNSKIKNAVGWKNEISLQKSLEDIIHYFDSVL